jgi:hypothetical protein
MAVGEYLPEGLIAACRTILLNRIIQRIIKNTVNNSMRR